MQMIVAVELRLISGCIVGTLMHNLSLGIQRTLFYIMYVYKVSLLFRIFSLTSLASRSREKEKPTSSLQESGVQWKAGMKSMS